MTDFKNENTENGGPIHATETTYNTESDPRLMEDVGPIKTSEVCFNKDPVDIQMKGDVGLYKEPDAVLHVVETNNPLFANMTELLEIRGTPVLENSFHVLGATIFINDYGALDYKIEGDATEAVHEFFKHACTLKNQEVADLKDKYHNLAISSGRRILELEEGLMDSTPLNETPTETDIMRHVSKSLGVDYEQLTKDFNNTSYSSFRSVILEHQKRITELEEGLMDCAAAITSKEACEIADKLLGEKS